MKLTINGKEFEAPGALSVTALLAHQQVKMPDMVTVELNGEILERQAFESTVVKDGDRVEFLYFMGGGSMNLTESQIERYSRHILLPEVGGKGQEKLLAGKVLLVGAGGLGCPAGLYLAAAGVGTLGIMDADVVDLSNLQRQIAHATPDIGKPKVDSAAAKFKAINPDVTLRTYRERLTAANALGILRDYDFVIDGTDNFASKFLVADACHFAGKPYSHAGILKFDGQMMTVLPGQTACYRCVFTAPPPAGAVPSCSQAGVLGVLAGVMGTLQATEAIKFLLEQGDLLTNHLLTYQALQASFRKIPLKRNPKCPVCGEAPTLTELVDEEPPTCACKPGERCPV
jgi:thiamine biosynthesis protein ThiS